MAHPHDSLTPRRINTLLFEESNRDHEFSGSDTNGASNIQGISENINDNPDDPQPITSGVATPVLGPSTSGVASVDTSDPRPSTSGVANRNTPDRNDLLYKIREVFMYLKQKFSVYFYPFKNIVVDESLILFKGRLSFKQYIPSKHNRFGIKLFVMCDCESGLLVLDVIVYTGKNTPDDGRRMLGISSDVVRRMMEPYLGKGHTLYIDNWYTSPMLADFLRVNNTDICGTVRRNRKHMPRFTGGSVESEVQAFHANDIMALTWHDKRDVTLLSTIHRNEMVQTDRLSKFNNEPIVKPLAVVDYTNNMQLVDKCDMMIGFVDCVRRSRKWYIKLFFHLVDIAVLNAFNMYEVKTGKRQRFADFSLNLVKQIARKYGTTPVPSPQQQPVTPQPVPQPQPVGEVPDRITPNCHYLVPIPPTQKKKKSAPCCRQVIAKCQLRSLIPRFPDMSWVNIRV
ncbi:piggyBac transposable element-derived protein 4-like [Cherax quadricarinatus]|uniref:piggyBac transposable element-derived protein 4-like n=1 Tax=Cherax quadricarinatus TaxID=27406 RepID=UPI00387EAC38